MTSDAEPGKFEEDDRSIAELCAPSRVPHKINKAGRAILGSLVDRLRRQDASMVAQAQDSGMRHTESTRYNVNSYSGGPTSIRDIAFIKKRKMR